MVYLFFFFLLTLFVSEPREPRQRPGYVHFLGAVVGGKGEGLFR